MGEQAEQSEFPHSSEQPGTIWMAWMLGLHMSALNSLANETARVPILLSFSRAKPYSLEHPASFVQNDCFFVGACDLLEQV